MEEGSLRVDANVSVRPVGSGELGTRCEIKNMNSLRSLGRAIDYEAARQVGVLAAAGGTVAQETRHWDEADGRTHSMRSKEEAYDYRYFPEPDLVPLEPPDDLVASIAASLPSLPAQRRAAVAAASGLGPGADAVATVVRLDLDSFVPAVAGADAALAVRRLANEVAAGIDGVERLEPSAFARLVAMESGAELTAAQARTVLKELLAAGGDPDQVAARLGFEAMGPGQLAGVVEAVVAASPQEWARFAGGDDKLLGLFVGKVKVATGGRADLKEATALLRQRRG